MLKNEYILANKFNNKKAKVLLEMFYLFVYLHLCLVFGQEFG